MLTYDISKRGHISLYDYLYRCIREDILSGRIAPGEKLPSKRSLARHLDVSIITVENAYAQLQLEGYIFSQEKKGYFAQKLEKVERTSCLVRPRIREEEFEYSFFADLRSNRVRRRQFPFSTWAKLLRETLSAQDEMLLKTVPYNGVYELRFALSEFLREFRGMEVFPSQIIIGSGTEHLYCRLISLLGGDCRWAVEDIGNQKITGICNMYHAGWKYISVDEDGINMEDLRKSGCNVVHVSPAHHFPLGTVLPIKRRQELLAWAQEDNHYIIEDDYDSEFRYNGKAIAPLYSMDMQGKVIYMNTFSKTLIPSLRISYMVLPYALAERYREELSFYSGTVPSMEQYALARFISEGYFERHINHMQNYYKSLRNQLINAIKSSPLNEIAAIEEAGAGTHFLLRLETDRTDREIVEDAAKLDIDVASLSEYQAFPSGDSHTLIINYSGIHRERIDETVDRLWRAVSGQV
jgi:GntR family transcriptional regulator/MocR family aminotransferase